MPPRTALSTPLHAWRCPQCISRALSTTTRLQHAGPESPRYIQIPEPPQQTAPYRPWVRGSLPVPRDIFARKHGKDMSADEAIQLCSPAPKLGQTAAPGSREEWKSKVSAQRRQNLREGLKELRVRQRRTIRTRLESSSPKQAERKELLHRPEREDERLTAPSHNLDLETLFKGALQDPTREARLEAKRSNLESQQTAKQEQRLNNLHTLYTNARNFIVTPQQLDQAVDEAFGTDENPVIFAQDGFGDGGVSSVWALGRPERVQELLNKANRMGYQNAMQSADGRMVQVNKERMRRIAEALTGGRIDVK